MTEKYRSKYNRPYAIRALIRNKGFRITSEAYELLKKQLDKFIEKKMNSLEIRLIAFRRKTIQPRDVYDMFPD